MRANPQCMWLLWPVCAVHVAGEFGLEHGNSLSQEPGLGCRFRSPLRPGRMALGGLQLEISELLQ